MYLSISAAVSWLLSQEATALYQRAKRYLLERTGLSSSPLTVALATTLLEEYLQRFITKLDEDRIRQLYGGLRMLRDASKTTIISARESYFHSANNIFQQVIGLPEQGMTGEYSNAQLRCIAFLGIASAHIALNDSEDFIAEKMVEAIYADAATAQKWIGNDLVSQLLARNSELRSRINPSPLAYSPPVLEIPRNSYTSNSSTYSSSSISSKQQASLDDRSGALIFFGWVVAIVALIGLLISALLACAYPLVALIFVIISCIIMGGAHSLIKKGKGEIPWFFFEE